MEDLIGELKGYLEGPHNAPYEREFAAAKIRPLPMSERLALLDDALALDLPLGLNLACLSLKPSTYRSHILYPGILKADPATLREYLVYGMCRADVLHCIEAARPLLDTDPSRAAYILYYLAAFIGPGATACQESMMFWIMKLTATGYLDFNIENWEGGPDDLDWFVWLDGPRHWIWWPPIREAIDRRIGRTINAQDTLGGYRRGGWREAHVRIGSRYRPRIDVS